MSERIEAHAKNVAPAPRCRHAPACWRPRLELDPRSAGTASRALVSVPGSHAPHRSSDRARLVRRRCRIPPNPSRLNKAASTRPGWERRRRSPWPAIAGEDDLTRPDICITARPSALAIFRAARPSTRPAPRAARRNNSRAGRTETSRLAAGRCGRLRRSCAPTLRRPLPRQRDSGLIRTGRFPRRQRRSEARPLPGARSPIQLDRNSAHAPVRHWRRQRRRRHLRC